MPSLLHKQRNLALLIDADNAPHHLTRALLHRAACYGVLRVKRAYADWSRPNLRNYKALLQRFAIEPVHTYRHATGKNSADILMTIQAIELMNMGLLDGVCIGSSDSDFTHLAIRLRLEGLDVYGFGARQTPQAFVQACTRFFYLEDLEASSPGQQVFHKPRLRRHRQVAPARKDKA